jgi:CRP-like cAMP-binding protein
MADGTIDERQHTLAPDTFLARLTAAEREAICKLGVARELPRGSLLIFQREPGERVMLLLAGRVKVTRVIEDGREVMLSIRDPGDLLGELAFIDGEPRLASATALERVKAIAIPSTSFRRHLENTPRVAVVLLEAVTHRFRETTVKRSEFAASDTLGRLAARIAELADRYGEEVDAGVLVVSPLSQEELAAWTGASRAGTAQAMQTLRALGWLETERRKLVIRDIDALRARAA